eukprot:6203748-Pleurochrysis_carterae.AAC.2
MHRIRPTDSTKTARDTTNSNVSEHMSSLRAIYEFDFKKVAVMLSPGSILAIQKLGHHMRSELLLEVKATQAALVSTAERPGHKHVFHAWKKHFRRRPESGKRDAIRRSRAAILVPLPNRKVACLCSRRKKRAAR